MTHPSDLTDNQWDLIKNHFDTGNYGKSRKYSQRDLINGVFYPKIFPPIRQYTAFDLRAKQKGIWEKMMKDLVEKSRVKMGRNADPSYSLIDSQSVKTTSKARLHPLLQRI